MELPWHFFAKAKYENPNLPRHLPRQLLSAEANYKGWKILILGRCTPPALARWNMMDGWMGVGCYLSLQSRKILER